MTQTGWTWLKKQPHFWLWDPPEAQCCRRKSISNGTDMPTSNTLLWRGKNGACFRQANIYFVIFVNSRGMKALTARTIFLTTLSSQIAFLSYEWNAVEMVELYEVFSECSAFHSLSGCKNTSTTCCGQKKRSPQKDRNCYSSDTNQFCVRTWTELFARRRHVTLTFLQFACETLLVGIQMFHIIPPEKYKAFHRGRRGNAMTYLSEVAYICPHIYHSVDICMLCYMC